MRWHLWSMEFFNEGNFDWPGCITLCVLISARWKFHFPRQKQVRPFRTSKIGKWILLLKFKEKASQILKKICAESRPSELTFEIRSVYFRFLFLGGLSLHLNHLITSRAANYDWPFGTLPFGLFGSNLDTRDLETYPRTYSGHFWNMSIFDNSRAVWVLFRKWVVSENQSFLNEGAIVTPLISLVLGEEVPRLNHGPICFPIQNT